MLYSTCVFGQKIVSDTTLIVCRYGEYCESIQICETTIPDSLYEKLKGKLPDPHTEIIPKYRSTCFEVGYDTLGGLYSYKDFILSVGGFHIEYSFPQFSYYLKLHDLVGDQIELVNSKNGEKVRPDWIEVMHSSGERRSFKIDDQNEEFISFLNDQKHNSIIELKISPIKYPNNNERCGNVMHNFPSIKVELMKNY